MEGSASIVLFLFTVLVCKGQDTPRGFSSSDTVKNDNSLNINKSSFQPSSQYVFNKKAENSTSNTWSPWIPSVRNATYQRYNYTNKEEGNTTKIFSISLLNHTSAMSNFSRNQNSSAETKKSMPTHLYHTNYDSLSKGLTHYFWDTIYIMFRCFRDHWSRGVLDCVTARASTLLDGLLGFEGVNQFLGKSGLGLTDLAESPRNDDDDGLTIPLEDDDDAEYDNYDDQAIVQKDSREAGRRKKNRKEYRVKHMHKILNVVVSTALMALPVIIALKLKFFMLLSVGIAALSLVSGKAFILSMVSFVLAIVAVLKKATHKGYSISRIDDYPYPSYASRKGIDEMYAGGRGHTNYFM